MVRSNWIGQTGEWDRHASMAIFALGLSSFPTMDVLVGGRHTSDLDPENIVNLAGGESRPETRTINRSDGNEDIRLPPRRRSNIRIPIAYN